jgi:hypothetical protein
MAKFEDFCKNNDLDLAVLAPKSPKLNGQAERINGTWRTDFYELYDLPTQLTELSSFYRIMWIHMTGTGHMTPWVYRQLRNFYSLNDLK